jgi:signal transduction histidine kinase/CheY-like chemotaxis protein
MFRESIADILLLRSVGTLCIVTAGIVVLMRPASRIVTDNALSFCIVSVYVVSLGMIAETAFPYNYLFYFVCLPLILMFMFGLFRFESRRVYLLTGLCLGLTLLFLLFVETTDSAGPKHMLDIERFMSKSLSYYYVAPALFIVTFSVVGCAIAVELERTARAAFRRERELEEKNGLLAASERDTRTKTAALVKAKEDLRAMAEEKAAARSKFLADAAHDLRQPMQALSTLLGATSDALVREDGVRARRLLGDAQDAVRLTRDSFNAVLDISRLESGFVEPDYSNFDLPQLVEEVVANCRFLAEERGVEIRFRWNKARAIAVRSDRHLLARVIVNLLSNAIKYSDPARGERAAVLVGIVVLPNRVRLDIVDNGIGIARSDWQRVFQPFVQLGNAERDREKGVGLGLSIVNAIASLLVEHRIDMRSARGKGTRISVELPLADAPLEALTFTAGQRVAIDDLAGLFVLYVEDDQLVRNATMALFEGVGLVCESYASFAALEKGLPTVERPPDLILSDYRLPEGRTGAEVIRAVRAQFEEEVPALLLTGDVMSEQEAAGAMAMKVLRKPIAPESLLREISLASAPPAPARIGVPESSCPAAPPRPSAPSGERL